MAEHYDVIIVGGGLSGILIASRLTHAKPDLGILLLEKEPTLGGRIKRNINSRHWTFGLDFISEELFQFWNSSLKSDPDALDLPNFLTKTRQSFGVIIGGDISVTSTKDLLSPTGFKMIGGPAAARDWHRWDQFCKSIEKFEAKGESFSQLMKVEKNSPSMVVLAHLARAAGISDLSSTSAEAAYRRINSLRETRYTGQWDKAISATLEASQGKSSSLHCGTTITKSEFFNSTWSLYSGRDVFTCNTLVVAQTPWEASLWLPRDQTPQAIAAIVSHVQPTSVVSLCAKSANPISLPDFSIIPSEDAQILKAGDREICIQATLGYESTFEAPTVVKAVRRLKRAKKKVEQILNTPLSGEHLALLPIAWNFPVLQSERRFIDRLKKGDYQSSKLIFCGDSYGVHLEEDRNLIESILQAESIVLGSEYAAKGLSILSQELGVSASS